MYPQPFAPLPCLKPDDNEQGTRWFHERANGEWTFAIRYCLVAVVLAQNAHIWLVLGALYLDSEPPRAISPGSRRGISSRRLFLRGSGDRFPTARKYAMIL